MIVLGQCSGNCFYGLFETFKSGYLTPVYSKSPTIIGIGWCFFAKRALLHRNCWQKSIVKIVFVRSLNNEFGIVFKGRVISSKELLKYVYSSFTCRDFNFRCGASFGNCLIVYLLCLSAK